MKSSKKSFQNGKYALSLQMVLCDQVAIYVSLVGLSDYTVATNSDTMVNLV